jgi:hypothetical protein
LGFGKTCRLAIIRPRTNEHEPKGNKSLKVLDTIDQDYKLEKVVFGYAIIFRLVMRTATALKQPEQYQVGYLLPANI